MNAYNKKFSQGVYLLVLLMLFPVFAYAGQDKELSDTWLEAKLETSYLFNSYINPFEIGVDVRDGVAYLSGAVDESVDKDLAGEIAKSIDGMKSVENNIEIKPGSWAKSMENRKTVKARSFATVVRDATITATVKSKLLWNRNTDGLDINVSTENGIVTLEGTSNSSATKELAEQFARNTSEVKDVNNKLLVENQTESVLGQVDLDQAGENAKSAAVDVGRDITDGWISAKVKSTLIFSSDVNSSYIDVTTENGIVTLNGRAVTDYQKSRAEELSKNIRGVKDVKNSLSVKNISSS